MNQDFSDELISAYLDGELTAEEQARVEQMLVDSAEHRTMFEELRALRDSLQALPSYELADDFADRVVSRVQRVMSKSDTSEQNRVSPAAHDAGNWRAAVTAMAGVAAALVISIVFLPSPDTPERRVAGNQNGAAPAANESGDRKLAIDSATDASSEAVGDLTSHEFSTTSNPTPMPDVTVRTRSLQAASEELPRIPANEKFAATIDKSVQLSTAPAPTTAIGGGAESDNTPPAMPNSYGTKPQAAVDRYIVLVEMENKAFVRGALDEALVRGGIAMSVSSAEEAEENSGRQKNRGNVAGEVAPAQTNPNDGSPQSKMTNGNVDVVIIEAPIAQIQATFDELHRSGHLVALSVHSEHRTAASALYYQSSLPKNMPTDSFAIPGVQNARKDSAVGSVSPESKSGGRRADDTPSPKLGAAPSPQAKSAEDKAGVAGKNKANSGKRAKQDGERDKDKLVESRGGRAELFDMKEEAAKKLGQRSSGYALRVVSPGTRQLVERLEQRYRSSMRRATVVPQADFERQEEGKPKGTSVELFKFADNVPGNQQQDAHDRIVHLSLVIRSVPSSLVPATSLKAKPAPAKD